MKKIFILFSLFFTVFAKKYQDTAPVAILKQIDKHNEDGSYTYGYEAADGTFKIETKYPDGEVHGKYGYVDDTGTLREVEYGASRRGFEPAGNEIQVAPPTLKQRASDGVRALGPEEEDDGQYREDPSVYYQDDPYVRNNHQQPRVGHQQPQTTFDSRFDLNEYEPEPAYRPKPVYRPQTSYKPKSYYSRVEPEPAPAPRYRPQSNYGVAEEYEEEPYYRPQQQSYRPQPQSYRPQPQSYRPQPQSYTPQPQSYRPQPEPYRPQSNFGFNNNNNFGYSSQQPTPSHYAPTYNNGFGNVDWQTGSYSVNYKR